MSENIYDFYYGFYINQPLGNNAFSYADRKNKKIYVPPLIRGHLSDLSFGDQVVFSEIEDGIEINKSGLKNFVHLDVDGKEIFIFDNHNHAFFFWIYGWKQKKIKQSMRLVHIDQHTDMREPDDLFLGELEPELNLDYVFNYTNYQLNVGNFIKPAIDIGLFSSVEMVNSSTSLENPLPDNFVLDIDMDFFAPELDYINNHYRLAKIQTYIEKTSFITLATSPFFIEQSRAIRFIRDLFQCI